MDKLVNFGTICTYMSDNAITKQPSQQIGLDAAAMI